MKKGNQNKDNSYRRDRRSTREFKRDIALGTAIEKKIIKRYARYVDDVFGIIVHVEDGGCDNSGKYLKDEEVSATADYRLNGRPVEVKFNNEVLTTFHLKQSQLKSYLKQRAIILWVNGWTTDEPVFTILKKRHLEHISRNAELVNFHGWGGKRCYRLHKSDFKWYSF